MRESANSVLPPTPTPPHPTPTLSSWSCPPPPLPSWSCPRSSRQSVTSAYTQSIHPVHLQPYLFFLPKGLSAGEGVGRGGAEDALGVGAKHDGMRGVPHVLAKGRCAPRANSRPTRDGRAGQRGERTAEEEERGGAAPALLGVGYFRLLDCVEEAVPEAGLELKREAGKSVGKSGEEERSGGGG